MITIFKLLRASIDGQVPDLGVHAPEAQQWWSIFRLLQHNHCAALACNAVTRLPKEQQPPRDVLIPWLSEQQKAIGWHRYQQKVQQEIIDTLARRGIETLVLKGTHTAQYYPQPELREFGDLDLYFGDRHNEADQVVRKELGVTINNDSHHHTKYNYRGVTVESHYDFVNTHYPRSNRDYEQILKELAPSPTFEVLFLLRHMAGHFAASRITLRDLVDWALTCRTLHDKVDWPLVERTIEGYGMTEFVSVLNSIIEHRLGVSLSLPNSLSRCLAVSLPQKVERDLIYGSPETDDKKTDGLGRLGWKLRRWNALAWKRKMVYSDSSLRLMLASLTSHTEKPRSILHKQ